MLAPHTAPDPNAELAASIAAFLREGSIEATRPAADDIAAVAALLPGSDVYLSAIPGRPLDEARAAPGLE